MDWVTLEKHLPFIVSNINILGGNNKTVVWLAYASPNIGCPLPNKSDTRQQPTKWLFTITDH